MQKDGSVVESDEGVSGSLPNGLKSHHRHHFDASVINDVRLIHKKLPKAVTNILSRSFSLQPPPPVPRNSKRSQQLEEILAPLHLTLLAPEELGTLPRRLSKAASDAQLKILRTLIHQIPDKSFPGLCLPALQLEAKNLRESECVLEIYPSPREILHRTERHLIKNKEVDLQQLNMEREKRLSKILNSVEHLEASVNLKKRTWMYRPRNGTSKSKLYAELRFRRQLRQRLAPEIFHVESDADSGEVEDPSEESISNTSRTNQVGDHTSYHDTVDGSKISRSKGRPRKKVQTGDDETSKMPPPAPPPRVKTNNNSSDDSQSSIIVQQKPTILTKAQLKHVPKKQSGKAKFRVLTLQRNIKIRPGTLFKCRRTKEKFTFSTLHRTITESGLALLTTAYALRFGAAYTEPQKPKSPVSEISHKISRNLKESSKFQNWFESFGSPSIRELAHMSELTSHGQQDGRSSISNKVGSLDRDSKCYCHNRSKEKVKKKTNDQNVQNHSISSIVTLNRYTQSLEKHPIPEEFPPGGIFDHTIELLSYGRELRRCIYKFKTEGVLLDIGSRPELKIYPRKPFGKIPVQTAQLEKVSVHEALNQGVCDVLAHSGFTKANLNVIETLSEVLGSFYEDFTSRLKGVIDKEVAEMSHGFLDPIDRVCMEVGLKGGVRGLADYYEHRLYGYHETVESWVERLENKFGTCIAYKVRGNLGSSSTSKGTTSSVSVGAGAGNRNSNPLSNKNIQGFPMKIESVCSIDSRHDSTDLLDSLNLQIDSVPSLSSV